MTNLLNAAKVVLSVLDTFEMKGNTIENLRAAIADAEKQEPVLYMDNRTDVVSPALRHTRKGYDTPLYLHPAPTMSEGMMLVPIEPTPEMKQAAHAYKQECAMSNRQRTYGGYYRAMLAAAPKPENKS